MTTTAAAGGTRRHTGTYPAESRQVGLARAALAGWLDGCPQADEAILVASEFATNSVLHSASRHVVREDYSRARIGLAFRPTDDTFDVTSAAIARLSLPSGSRWGCLA